jgi:hypothetical protein
MTIGPVGGVSLHQQLQSPVATAKTEAAEVPGAPDHDGDADDVTTKGRGSVNVKA